MLADAPPAAVSLLSGRAPVMYLRPTSALASRAPTLISLVPLDVADLDPPAGAPQLDDAGLVRAMHGGDGRAAGVLYDRHAAMVMGLALAIVRDRTDAESVVLDTFTQVWRSAARYDPTRGSVVSWLVVLTRSRALDLVRSTGRRARLTPVSVDDAPAAALVASDGSSNPSLAVEASERQVKVAAALAELPDAQRSAIELAFFDGLSHSEIADRLAEPLGTVKTRIRLGMTKLRHLLRPFGEGVVQ